MWCHIERYQYKIYSLHSVTWIYIYYVTSYFRYHCRNEIASVRPHSAVLPRSVRPARCGACFVVFFIQKRAIAFWFQFRFLYDFRKTSDIWQMSMILLSFAWRKSLLIVASVVEVSQVNHWKFRKFWLGSISCMYRKRDIPDVVICGKFLKLCFVHIEKTHLTSSRSRWAWMRKTWNMVGIGSRERFYPVIGNDVSLETRKWSDRLLLLLLDYTQGRAHHWNGQSNPLLEF